LRDAHQIKTVHEIGQIDEPDHADQHHCHSDNRRQDIDRTAEIMRRASQYQGRRPGLNQQPNACRKRGQIVSGAERHQNQQSRDEAPAERVRPRAGRQARGYGRDDQRDRRDDEAAALRRRLHMARAIIGYRQKRSAKHRNKQGAKAAGGDE
jgi:hypothetical protein